MNSTPTTHPSLWILLLVFFLNTADAQNATVKTVIDVGVILDLGTGVGKMSQSCLSMALSDFYSTYDNYSTRVVLHTRDSNGDNLDAASAAIDLLKNVQVQAILGPQKSSQAEFVVNIGNKTRVPVISFSATSPSLSFLKTPYFIRTALNDSSQIKAIAAFIQTFGWRDIVPICEDTGYGHEILPYLTDAIQEINAQMPYRSAISPLATDDQIQVELLKLKTMHTRVFIVHMSSSIGSRLFSKANELGMMSKGYVWIMTSGLTGLLGSMESSIIESMQGVVGVKPYVPRSKKLYNFKIRWRKKMILENPDIDNAELCVFGLRAYDSIWTLAMAVERVNEITFPRFKKSVDQNSNYLATIGASQMGPKLLEEILRTNFRGLSGDVRLQNGQLVSSAFQITNVIGKGEKEIGFWTPAKGISKTFNTLKGKSTYSVDPMHNLGAIVWPGDSTLVPKGWDLSGNENKLRFGVPVKDGFSEFVKVEQDPRTKAVTVTGFCIDVFKAVMDSLPYKVPYEFVPLDKDDVQYKWDYDNLVYQVYLKKYDAVIGDTTILANRTLYVDFALPFTESGVSIIVPIKGDDRKDAWIFLKPLTRDLWFTTAAFFLLIGFAVWILEHQVNIDFRGSPSEQIGVVFWFSFSTLVFAHKEKVMSNLARFVMIVWFFVVLILTQSYTANLTSMLTVQKLQPTITGIEDLIKNGYYVGYQGGSFVPGLVERLKIDQSKLRALNTSEEYDEALARGSSDGGVAAIIDEIPYVKLFLAKYCTKYTTVGPTYKTAGFGFAFPKGSPLVPDISRAVLSLSEGNKMAAIEQAWFGRQTYCSERGATVTSDSLTLDSFRGLFLIAGIATAIALLIFLLVFVSRNKGIITSKELSTRQKLKSLAKKFDQHQKKHKKTGPRSSFKTIVYETDGANTSPLDSTNDELNNTTNIYEPQEVFCHNEGFLSTEANSPNREILSLVDTN